jgi:hypothetical protein
VVTKARSSEVPRFRCRARAAARALPPHTWKTDARRVVCAREPRRASGKRAVIRVIRGGRLVRLRQRDRTRHTDDTQWDIAVGGCVHVLN